MGLIPYARDQEMTVHSAEEATAHNSGRFRPLRQTPSFWIASNDATHVDLSCPVHPEPRRMVMKIGNPLNSLNVVDLADNNGVSLIHSLSCYGRRQVVGTMRVCSCTPLETIRIALAKAFQKSTCAVVPDPRPPNVQAFHWILQ